MSGYLDKMMDGLLEDLIPEQDKDISQLVDRLLCDVAPVDAMICDAPEALGWINAWRIGRQVNCINSLVIHELRTLSNHMRPL